ncbi:MAG: hypothetical protein K1X74_01745 [Pirellulales bacterium]|nr:hypothetical protein [Pirellulales bacterium]
MLVPLVLAAALVGPWAASRLLAQGAYRDDFSGLETAWRPVGADGAHQVVAHRRLPTQGHAAAGCELLEVSASNASYIHYVHEVPAARLIEELQASVYVRSDRPGVQLMARVVLPRTKHPRSGGPLVTYLRGTSAAATGDWQLLQVGNLVALLGRQAPALRAEWGSGVDLAEAFVDALVLNVYGGPGTTTILIDDLEVVGAVSPTAVASDTREPPSVDLPGSEADNARHDRVELQGAQLRVGGRVFVPRLLEYRGEPLAWVRQRGFNGIWSFAPLSPEVLSEARAAGLWIVGPPPPTEQPVDAVYGRMLAWLVGEHLTHEQFDAMRVRIEQLRRADRDAARPVVAGVDADLRLYSRHLDALLLDRAPLGTSLELPAYRQWLRSRPALARPGTPAWVTIQTQFDAVLERHLEQVAGRDVPEPVTEPEQLRLVALAAAAAGAHGFLFRSRDRLDAGNASTLARAAALELLNLELATLEPWLAGGQAVAQVVGNVPQVSATMLQLDRARLLMPAWSGTGAQFVPGQSAGRNVTFVVPGVPEAHKAYQATPAGLTPIDALRVNGGKRVVLEEFGLAGAVVFAPDQDPQLLGGLNRNLAGLQQRAAELGLELAETKFARTQAVLRRLDPGAQRNAVQSGWITAAQEQLADARAKRDAGEWSAAYLAADRALRPLRLLQHSQWQQAIELTGLPVTSPLGVSFDTLGEHARLWAGVSAAALGANRLAAGDMENLDALVRAGWRHVQSPRVELAVDVGLSPDSPHAGRWALRLNCQPRQAQAVVAEVEAPTVWITSAAVPVEAGQWVRIDGWVRVDRPITGSVDGLMAIDSLGGEALAARWNVTDGWQAFTLYRAAAASGAASITFVLTGIGTAWIDDVAITPVTLLPGAPLETARRPGAVAPRVGVRQPAFSPPPVRR